ncbi:MAG TPA: hypothetical protein VMU75_06780 [Acidimicrobiales bacterium]|nr:hypothetical protein [Acidimicrobiales bacterium]
MSAGWVAAQVRGRGLARRRLGADGARRLATSPSLPDALAALAPTPYGRTVRAGTDLADAQHGVSATVVWHLRILAGWSPPLGSGPLRVLASGFEIANITGHLARLRARPAPPPYALGSMATAWPAVSAARTPAEVRAALGSSVWGDPGSDEPSAIHLTLQLCWARRVYDGVPGAAGWAVAKAALVAGRLVAAGAVPSLSSRTLRDADHLLGARWHDAASLGDLASRLSPAAARTLVGVEHGEDLWRAEARWWSALDAAGAELAARPRPEASSTIGVVALLAADAWRVRAALALAAQGGGDLGEVLDAVA